MNPKFIKCLKNSLRLNKTLTSLIVITMIGIFNAKKWLFYNYQQKKPDHKDDIKYQHGHKKMYALHVMAGKVTK